MINKYFEVKEPYYALMQVEDENELRKEYLKSVSEIVDDNFEYREISKFEALYIFLEAVMTELPEVTVESALVSFNEEGSSVKLIDGNLL